MPAAQPANDPQNTVYLDTKDGRITIRLRPDLAPKHVEQIKTLTKQGFYDAFGVTPDPSVGRSGRLKSL